MALVTLLSDFGTRDGFAGAMKGVVLAAAPDARVVDITHEITPGDVEAGAWVLSQYWDLYPRGSVHVAVVDPGVGGSRRAIALEADERFVVAPDNGLVTRVIAAAKSWRCVEISEARYIRAPMSNTFHGRDVFAPVAAHIAGGVTLDQLGPPLAEPVRLDIEPPTRLDDEIRGRVAHVDRFGNLITDIPGAWVDERWRFEVAGKMVGSLRRAYSDVRVSELAAVIGSADTVEIAARESSASKKLGVARGDPVLARLQADRR